jgi:hypothetical protein
MRPIPLQASNKAKLVDILTPDTTVFSLFIPFSRLKYNVCPIPKGFIKDLARQARFFQSKGMRYVFATDPFAMTKSQFEKLSLILKEIHVDILDISTLDGYFPFNKRFSRYQGKKPEQPFYHVQSYKAEYIDKTKVMIANLAGKKTIKNVLVTDFDIIIDGESLKILKDEALCFTYSGRHEKPSTQFNTENSMIFVSKDRPTNTQGADLIQSLFKRIEEEIESNKKMHGAYGCFVFSALCHDTLIDMPLSKAKQLFYNTLQKNIIEKTREDEKLYTFETIYQRLKHCPTLKSKSESMRISWVNEVSSSGQYLIHGDYYSPNTETWRHPEQLSFATFEGAKRLLHDSLSTPIETSSLLASLN